MKFSSSPRPNLSIWFLPIALILVSVASGSAQETPESAVPAATAKKDKAPVAKPATPTLSPGVEDIIKLVAAGVDAEIVRNYVAHSKTPYTLTANDIIALKEKKVPDDVTAAMLLRGQQQKKPKRVAMPRIVQQLSTGGELDTESYEFFQNHYLYPRALSSSYKTLAPHAPQNNRGRGYGNSRFGNRGQSRFGSSGPSRNDRRGGHSRGGRFGR
ncbi:MAG: hypothetical protein ACI9VS_003149 [Candidatus Binatia bacterium]|jgi:hypothetical protein